MVDLVKMAEDRIGDIAPHLDKIGADIKNLEAFFKKRVFMYVKHDDLEWRDGRLLYSGKPLVEAPVTERIEQFKKLPAFIGAASKVVEKADKELRLMFGGK